MSERTDVLFDPLVWGPALESYGAIARLTVVLYAADERIVCGPVATTPLFAAFQAHGCDPGLFAECARECLSQSTDKRAPVVMTRSAGLAAVGVSLLLHGRIVGAAVAGYALVTLCESVAIARMARGCGVPFPELWALTRSQTPLPVPRLVLHGELLRVLGDTLLRENDLRQESERTATQLAHLAHYDALTDLPNRALLAERLARAVSLAERYGRMLAVLFLDIDRFKHINDSLGHPTGDELLRAVGQDLTMCVRNSDTVGRQSGDEFIVVLSEVTHSEDAAIVAQKIIAALAEPRQLAGHTVRVSASIGISVFPNDGADAETLLKHADMALYGAKDMGRGRYEFFQPALDVRAVERREIEAGLYTALANREFELFFQPKIQLNTGVIIGAEALIRWRHPLRGLVPPNAFVPVAEASGLIGPIGEWVVREACRQARAWQDAGLPPIPVAVNISAVEFRRHGFLRSVIDSLEETRLESRYLEMELTETALMAPAETTDAVLKELKDIGVQLAIDDFGTGWSSLSYLTRFPIDALKIDRSFVREISAQTQAAPIVSAVISLGKNLNLRVVAEGVETREQLAFLRAHHCTEGQGYLFSRPLDAEQFVRVLETGMTSS